MKGRKKMNNDLMEFGKVLIQWGLGFIGMGILILILGLIFVYVGKTFFEDKFDLLMATITYHLNN